MVSRARPCTNAHTTARCSHLSTLRDHGLAFHRAPRPLRRDEEGSAKVALLCIDRSVTAWQELVDRGLAAAGEADGLSRELCWLRARLQQVVPKAREFKRPGFDEPEALARLRATLTEFTLT